MGETGLIVTEFLPNLRDFPICRMDPKRDTYHVSKCHWFRQACTYLKSQHAGVVVYWQFH